jgi:hypothetical protein
MASTRQTASTAQDLVSAALRLDRLVGSSGIVAQSHRAGGGRNAAGDASEAPATQTE